MLSIAKLRVGQEAYQLSGVAQSLDDYYTGVGESAGQWIGVGAERLSLDGDVNPDDLRAVLAGIAPGTGGLSPNGETIRPHPRRVPGFDLTFKAPKSVSVLYAVTDDPRVQGAIIEAGETAVRQTIGWLEREAVHVRRGTGNEAFLADLAGRDPAAARAARIRSLPGQGVVAATFRHRTSRAGDPLLHWHTLVANMVEGPDGRWTAFVHPDLYRAARAAGEVFQTLLRAELTERLGIEWHPGRHVGEVAGVPQHLCEQFSKRSREIEDWLEATGTADDAAGRQAAVLATRRSKPEVEHERFDTAWKAEATAAGWGPPEAEDLIAHSTASVAGVDEVWHLTTKGSHAGNDVGGVGGVVDPEAWIAALCRDLTESDSTFTQIDITQAIAARLGDGATMSTLERVINRVLASPHLVPIGDEPGRWTSLELLAVERRFLDAAHSTIGTRESVAATLIDETLVHWSTLGDDQHDAVRMLASSRDGVTVMIGPAGTGKTYTLDAVRTVYEAAGFEVRGAAPSARAAHELQAGAHIESSTMHRLSGAWSRGYDLPNPRTVLVIDEAAMAGTRDLETIVTQTVNAGGRVIMVGDHHQLPEITAGGGFAALATDPRVTVATLTVNRRQHHEWERDALAKLRHGRVADAVSAYQDHDRLVTTHDRSSMINAAINRWLTATDDGAAPVLLAGTNELVNTLNAGAREALRDRGQLGATVGTWNRRELALGERIVLRINDYIGARPAGRPVALLNGHSATVTGVTDDGVVVRLEHDATDVVLGSDYLNAGGVDYGYALTSHRAQGGTWDLAIAVGAEGLYREAGYLVMSRGRVENWLMLTAPELEDINAELSRHDSPIPLPGEEPNDVDAELLRRLNTSRAKLFALSHDPQADTIAALVERHDLATLERLAAETRSVEQQAMAIIGEDPAVIAARLERTRRTATYAAIGQTVKAIDRDNVGTITALNDDGGAVRVLFVSNDGHCAERDLLWRDIQIIEPRMPSARELTPSTRAVLDAMAAPDRRQLDRWRELLASHGQSASAARVHDAACRTAIDRASNRLASIQPAWLTTLLGERPTAPAAARVWDDTVKSIARYRGRNGISGSTLPFGPAPSNNDLVESWNEAQEALVIARVWLETHTVRPTVPIGRSRSLAELHERLQELDAILNSAPPDQRRAIDEIRSGGHLPFDGLTDMLTEALAAQGERRRWILEHWPHIVEYEQLSVSMARSFAGPELETHTAQLDPVHWFGQPS